MTYTDQRAPIDVHDPTLTAVEIARRIDELVRALNYATRHGDARLRDGTDAYSVFGALREAFAKVPQACSQLTDFLEHRHALGTLVAVPGFAHSGAPDRAVAEAADALDEAADLAAAIAATFGQAQSSVSGLADEPDLASREERGRRNCFPGPGLGVPGNLEPEPPGLSL